MLSMLAAGLPSVLFSGKLTSPVTLLRQALGSGLLAFCSHTLHLRQGLLVVGRDIIVKFCDKFKDKANVV